MLSYHDPLALVLCWLAPSLCLSPPCALVAYHDRAASENKLLLDRMTASEQRTDQLQTEFTQAQAEITRLQDALAREEQARNKVNDELVTMKKQHSLVDRDRCELADQILALTAQLAALQEQVRALLGFIWWCLVNVPLLLARIGDAILNRSLSHRLCFPVCG